MHKNDLSNRSFSFHIQIIQVKKVHVLRFNLKRLSCNDCMCTKYCKSKTSRYFLLQLGDREKFSHLCGKHILLGLPAHFVFHFATNNKENENPHTLFSGGVSDLCYLALPWYFHVFSPFGFSNLSKDWSFKKFETDVTANLNQNSEGTRLWENSAFVLSNVSNACIIIS